MALTRSNTQASSYSQSSQSFPQHDVQGEFPDTEAARAVSTQQTLSEAIHARRAEFTRPHTIRIKVGTWNSGARKGTPSDIGAWFVRGGGVHEPLTGLENTHISRLNGKSHNELPTIDRREDIVEQERRVAHEPKKATTVPISDHGEIPREEDIGLYVLGLQEIVDITSPTEALRPYSDPAVPKKWRENIEQALPRGYQFIAQQQLTGLMMFMYASPTVAPQISSVSTTSCGTGLMGYMGNKGAVTTRIVLGETTRLVFINSHLSSGLGEKELERRNWDATQIVNKTQYDPIVDSLGYVSPKKEHVGDEDFGFWFGDLNYRIEDVSGHEVRRLLELHTRNEYDVNSHAKSAAGVISSNASDTSSEPRASHESTGTAVSTSTGSLTSTNPTGSSLEQSRHDDGADDGDKIDPSSDPSHLQSTLDSLLPHDELRKMKKQRKVFHDGWREGPITFLPTYKYDVGSVAVFDSTDKKRGPSWCDRILYRTRKDKTDYENMLIEEQDAERKDKELEATGVGKAVSEESTLYEYDPEADGDEDVQYYNFPTGDDPMKLVTHEGYSDLIQLEYYVSHQRILSSDHKPLDAVFRLEYDAVVPDLKSKVHQEVARDLDRAENEARPVVTLIPDIQPNGDGRSNDTVYFGDMRYEEEKVQTLTLANIGRGIAIFGFLSRQQGDANKMVPTPDWLAVAIDTPSGDLERSSVKLQKSKNEEEWSQDIESVYSLEPGCTCTIKLTACVNSKRLAKRLNQGGVLDDILILRVKEGRDHFVLANGTWLPTVFGRAVDGLIRIPEGGVRKLKQRLSTGVQDDRKEQDDVTSSAPKELFKLTQAIEMLTERTLAEVTMLHNDMNLEEEAPWINHAGWPFEGWISEHSERQKLRTEISEALDTGRHFDDIWPADVPSLNRLEALCDTLMAFIDSLDDGIIPPALWNEIVLRYFNNERTKLAVSRDDQRAAILEVLSGSPPHRNSFVLLTSTLSTLSYEVANSAQESKIEQMPTSSPKAHVRRKTLSVHPATARRQLIQKSYAAVLAEVAIRLPDDMPLKAKNTSQDQGRQLVEIFLDQSGATG